MRALVIYESMYGSTHTGEGEVDRARQWGKDLTARVAEEVT
jgi:hypothetical protein